MQAKSLLLPALSALLSLFINFLLHHTLSVALLNSLTLGLSVCFFQYFLPPIKSLFNNFFIIFLGAIPLFFFIPTNKFFLFLPLFFLGFLYLYKRFSKKYVLIICGLFLLFGNLYSDGIIEYPFSVQSSQLIFNSPEISYNMHRHQQDALFIPYKARLLVYSPLIYVYAALTNLFYFFNLKNLSEILLFANLYPLFTGIYIILKQKNSIKNIFLAALLITATTIGIDRSTDPFQSLYLLGPIFIYIILLGMQAINRKLYIILWILSLFLIIY